MEANRVDGNHTKQNQGAEQAIDRTEQPILKRNDRTVTVGRQASWMNVYSPATLILQLQFCNLNPATLAFSPEHAFPEF
ncbi:MAG TPA: hypothetical protein V6C65_11485 [Allocoleopsis sp.]